MNKNKIKFKPIIIIAIILSIIATSSKIIMASTTSSKQITTQDTLLEDPKNDDSLKSQVDKNIEKNKLFKSKEGFVKYIKENQTLTSSIISNDGVVLKWNQNLNDASTSKQRLNQYIVKNSKAMTFKHVKLSEDYELFSSIIPFTLKITYNPNKYDDFIRILQTGKVGINNLTIMGKTITSKYSLKPVNKEIVIGSKPYIKLKSPQDYGVKNVEEELNNLKLKPQIKNDDKPENYKEISGGANYIQKVSTFHAQNLSKLKEGDSIEVHVTWQKQSDSEIEKLELKKAKEDTFEQLKNTKGLSSYNYKSYEKILNSTNSKEKVEEVVNELKDIQKKYDEDKKLKSSVNLYGSASKNTSAINMNSPEIKNASYGMPLADMSITQDLHDGKAIDYQPRGCYLHPGCVPAFAIAAGTAHVSSGGPYGNAVVIEHANGTCSRYAHLNSLSVVEGERVSQSDILGMVGTTGNSTGVHLHFELRSGGGSCFGSMINPHIYGM